MEEQQKYELTKQSFSQSDSLFFNVQKFEHAQRLAKAFAEATMIPEHYRRNIGNCLIGLNLADRMNADPLMVFQNTYIVHGKPGIEAKLAIALINTSGRFEPLKYEYKMDADGKVVECFAYAKEKSTGEILNGPEVTWEMVQAEGWDKPRAQMPSKWNTMRKLMFTYRAAMFFARVHIPEALLGFYTTEEIVESIDLKPQPNGTYEAPDLPRHMTAEEEREAQEKANAAEAAIKAEQEAFEQEKLKAAQAELERKREQAKKDLEERETSAQDSQEQPESQPNMIEWLRVARPSTSLQNAQEWLKQYKINEETIDFLEDRTLRDQLQKKKEKVDQYIADRQPPKEPPLAPGEHERQKKIDAMIAWCQGANQIAERDVTQEALEEIGYKNFEEVPVIEYGVLKTAINRLVG